MCELVLLFSSEHSRQLRNVITMGVVQLMSLDDPESPAGLEHTVYPHILAS